MSRSSEQTIKYTVKAAMSANDATCQCVFTKGSAVNHFRRGQYDELNKRLQAGEHYVHILFNNDEDSSTESERHTTVAVHGQLVTVNKWVLPS